MVSYCFTFLSRWRFGTVGLWFRKAFLGGLVFLGSPTSFSVAVSAPFPVEKSAELAKVLPAFSWGALQSASLAGVSVRYQSFSSPLAVAETAKRLADRTSLFQHVIVFRNKTVLSGTHGGWHWIAEMDAFGRGTRGVISALPMAAPLTASLDQLQVAGPGWLPVSAVLKFEHRTHDQGQVIVQRIYATGLPVAQTLAHVASHLMQAGWTRAALNWAPGMQQWQRRDKRLILAALPDSGTSTLFVHYSY